MAMENSPESDTKNEGFQRRPAKDAIFEALHQRIIAGKYAPGEWLRQELIAAQFGVSQTPVREALDLLVSAGVAERVPYRGVRVLLQLTSEEIADAYALRIVLDSVAARAAALNATAEQIDSLVNISNQTENLIALNDVSTVRQLNREFHQAIVAASGNALLGKLYTVMASAFPDWMLYEYVFRHPDLLQVSLTSEFHEHKAIVDAIAAKDASVASTRAIEHLRHRRLELVEFLGVAPELLETKERHLMS